MAIDGHHANTAGEYLGAAVWFEVFLADKAQTVVGNSFVPPGLSKEQTASLQDIAHKTVRP